MGESKSHVMNCLQLSLDLACGENWDVWRESGLHEQNQGKGGK